MISLGLLIGLTIILLAYAAMNLSSTQLGKRLGVTCESRSDLTGILNLGFTIIYVPLLLIAARFGARTFPGVWTPGNPILNEITQGRIFDIVEAMTLMCGAIDISIFARRTLRQGIKNRVLVWLRHAFLAFTVIVCLYALYVAAQLQRLP